MRRTQVVSVGEKLADEWFISAAGQVFDRHTPEITKAFSQCLPPISEIEKLWLQIKQEYLAIPEDTDGLDQWTEEIIKELRESENNH